MIAKRTLPDVSPSVTAALLILSRSVCEQHDLPAPDVTQILAATKSSRSAAYQTLGMLVERLPTLLRPRGRPHKPPKVEGDSASSAKEAQLTGSVLRYVMCHPGCVHKDRVRQQYTDGFRHFILEQHAAFASLELERFAAAVFVPLGTLKDWLHKPCATPAPAQTPTVVAGQTDVEPAHIQTVLDAWSRWHGSFVDFCDHVRTNLLIPMGRALVAHLLFAHGVP